MQSYEVPRTGRRPLRFDGVQLASASSDDPVRTPPRYHEVAVYRTAADRYVVAISLRTRFQGEDDLFRAEHSDDPAAIERVLREYDPYPPGIGYPERFGDKREQDRLRLSRRYEALVTDVFAQLGSAFAEELS